MSKIEGSKGQWENTRTRCVCVCDGVTLHLLHSLIMHSSYRYFSEPGTTLSNICQEADSVIIASCIKQEKPHSHHLSAVPSINTILLSVVKLTNDNFILGFSGCHTANDYQHTHTRIMKWRVKPRFSYATTLSQLWFGDVPAKCYSSSSNSS